MKAYIFSHSDMNIPTYVITSKTARTMFFFVAVRETKACSHFEGLISVKHGEQQTG